MNWDPEGKLILEIYHVDAFTDRLFSGNSASVVILPWWFPDDILQLIARENNLAETAFVFQENETTNLRWFTPEIEMDLCGHATLASAHVLFEHKKCAGDIIAFKTISGILTVSRNGLYYVLDFPSRPAIKCMLPEIIAKGLNIQPKESYKARDFVLVYDSENAIRNLIPNRAILESINLDPGGICVTAPGRDVDFVSRYFTPQASIFEDPVTGSAHCTLAPFWAERLKKSELTAKQLSRREGKIGVELQNNRVLLKGQAKTYMKGVIYLNDFSSTPPQ